MSQRGCSNSKENYVHVIHGPMGRSQGVVWCYVSSWDPGMKPLGFVGPLNKTCCILEWRFRQGWGMWEIENDGSNKCSGKSHFLFYCSFPHVHAWKFGWSFIPYTFHQSIVYHHNTRHWTIQSNIIVQCLYRHYSYYANWHYSLVMPASISSHYLNFLHVKARWWRSLSNSKCKN